MTSVSDLATPALLIDLDILERNLQRMQDSADRLGVSLRPHLKTHKCVEIAHRQAGLGARGVTVSTLAEARVFAAHGIDDLTWAFPVILTRLDEALELAARVTLRLMVDSAVALETVEARGKPLHVWLKVDCGYGRAGVDPESPLGFELARRLAASPVLEFDGILTHSGQAYAARGRDELAAVARHERAVMVDFARRLRGAGVCVPAVSIGSTPALSATDSLEGIDEIRPGNYALHDATQVRLGACSVADCAATVLTSVVSRRGGGRCVVDAGALALSKDAGIGDASRADYGRVFGDYERGRLAGERLVSLSQEHGVLDAGHEVGSKLRVLPNHSCLTVAQFDEAIMVRGDRVVDRWKIWRRRDAALPASASLHPE